MDESQLDGLELYQVMDLMSPLTPYQDISMWPATTGWAILGATIVLGVALALYLRHKRAKQRQHRTDAIVQISQLDERGCALQISAIMKRCALHDFSREQVASLTAQQWQAFLNERAPENVYFDDFYDLQYNNDGYDSASLKADAIAWIKHYKVAS